MVPNHIHYYGTAIIERVKMIIFRGNDVELPLVKCSVSPPAVVTNFSKQQTYLSTYIFLILCACVKLYNICFVSILYVRPYSSSLW